MKLTIGSIGFDGAHCDSREVELTNEEFDEYLSAIGEQVRETGDPMYVVVPEDMAKTIKGDVI